MESIENRILELTEAVCRLHLYEKVEASSLIAKLNEQGFLNISADFVQAIYGRLIEETQKNIKIKTIKKRILDLIGYLCELHRYDQTLKCAHIRNLNERGFKDVTIKFVRTIYDQLEKEHWLQNANKSIYYTCVLVLKDPFVMWSQRYFIIFKCNKTTEGDSHEVHVYDCYNDKSIQLLIEKSAPILWNIRYLSDCFGILVERDEDAEDNTRYVVSLIFLDLYRFSCKKLHTLEYFGSNVNIFKNKFDLTEFVLSLSIGDEHFVRICKIIGNEIVVGDPIQLSYPCAYFKGRFYKLLYYANQLELIHKVEVFIYNVEQQKEERFDVDLPKGYYICRNEWIITLAGNNVLVRLRFAHGGYVISRLNFQTRQWSFIEFATKNSMFVPRVFDGNNLITSTCKCKKNAQGQLEFELKFYKFLIRKPELLENMAWITLVKSMKKHDKLKDPYESARYFLPKNSSIRCPFD